MTGEVQADTSATVVSAMLAGSIVWFFVPLGPVWLLLTTVGTLVLMRFLVVFMSWCVSTSFVLQSAVVGSEDAEDL